QRTRNPSVPVGSAFLPRIPRGSWEHLVRRPFRSGRSLVSAPLPPEIISPHSRVKQTPLSHQDTTLSAHGLRNEMHLSRKMARDRSSLQAWFLQPQRNFSHVTRKQAM